MKTHTSGFKNEIVNLGRQLRGIITYNNVTLEDEIYSITPHYEGDILKSIMKQLDLELSVDIPLETVINCQIGIKVNGNFEMLNYGNYVVYKSEKQEDKNTYKITCYDKMLYSMKQNESLNVVYPISIKNYLIAVLNKIGLTLATNTFYNESLEIPNELYLGLDYTYRDILDEIAEATGSIICLNENDEVIVKYPTQTNDTINEEFLKDVNVNFAERYGAINTIVLSRSGESDNVYYPSPLSQNPVEIKIIDNQIMNFNNRSDFLEGIYNALNGLYYYINNFESTGILYYEVGDLYNIQVGENTYQCLMLNDEVNITTGIKEIIHTDLPTKSETDYTKADKTDRKINQTYLIVDKQNQIIESFVSNTAETTTTGKSYLARVVIEKINKSEPVKIEIRPLGTSISYLYPKNNLYPSDDLFMPDRIVRFANTTTNETFDYELPDDLLYLDENTYDEFKLDYENQICQVTKRVGYNADGTIYKLSNEVTTQYTYPKIEITSGDYEITIPGYSDAYLFVKLMKQNIYTDQFATKVEVSSEIQQTANSINLKVEEKLDEEDFTGANIMVAINNDSSSATINADKIDLSGKTINMTSDNIAINSTNFSVDKNGKVTATAGEIGGFELGQNSFTADLVSDKLARYTYTSTDATRVENIMAGNITPTSQDFDKYDFDYSGIITSRDAVFVTRAVQGILDGNATFILDTKNSEKALCIKNSSGKEVVDLGVFGSFINNISTNNLYSDAGIRTKGSFVKEQESSSKWLAFLGDSHINGQDTVAFTLYENSGTSTIEMLGQSGAITCSTVTQTSLESQKKNFEKLQSGLDIIKNIDIYKYNLKSEKENTKKHIGFVIGDKYNYSEEITSSENDGADIYSFVSVCCKAIQEQQEEIKILKDKINKLEKGESND